MKRNDLDAEVCHIALSLSPNISAKTLNNLRQHFNDDLAAVFDASPRELQRVRGIGEKTATEISRMDPQRVAAQIASWQRSGVAIETMQQNRYPTSLRDLDDGPPTLFRRGSFQPADWRNTVAIVGTRAPSQEAQFITLELSMKLARADCCVVSGLALGIDTAAHTGCLSAEGVTIAVLGSGVLNVYPPGNQALAERIRESGALLSELHPYASANAQRLVSRNRIISGLSRAVIVVESDAQGGAMYTARFAREQNRPVYTFDLPASGNQSLIKSGAIVLKRDDPLDFVLGALNASASAAN